jgi:hypothetical protein
MHPNKYQGTDGFNPGFYQHFWSICSEDIFKDCCEWLEIGQFPASLNTPNITLIPKANIHTTMKDHRPIALCNVLYKLISKVLVDGLKGVLPKCIYDNQYAFVSGRSILDNAMVTIEVIHYMKIKTRGTNGCVALKLDISKTRGTNGCVALKLDISKAYDMMDLKEVMLKMGSIIIGFIG